MGQAPVLKAHRTQHGPPPRVKGSSNRLRYSVDVHPDRNGPTVGGADHLVHLSPDQYPSCRTPWSVLDRLYRSSRSRSFLSSACSAAICCCIAAICCCIAATCAGVMPGTPCGPADPCGPTAPVSPLRPCGPARPCGPCAPVNPGSPFSPCEPVAPVAPVGPAGPVGPC